MSNGKRTQSPKSVAGNLETVGRVLLLAEGRRGKDAPAFTSFAAACCS